MCGDGTANTTFPVTLCGLRVLFPRISVPYLFNKTTQMFVYDNIYCDKYIRK